MNGSFRWRVGNDFFRFSELQVLFEKINLHQPLHTAPVSPCCPPVVSVRLPTEEPPSGLATGEQCLPQSTALELGSWVPGGGGGAVFPLGALQLVFPLWALHPATQGVELNRE